MLEKQPTGLVLRPGQRLPAGPDQEPVRPSRSWVLMLVSTETICPPWLQPERVQWAQEVSGTGDSDPQVSQAPTSGHC